MIDNGTKKWTVFTYRPESTIQWVVAATTWTDSGQVGNERIMGTFATESEARANAEIQQADYDRIRTVLLDAAKQVNNE